LGDASQPLPIRLGLEHNSRSLSVVSQLSSVEKDLCYVNDGAASRIICTAETDQRDSPNAPIRIWPEDAWDRKNG
jgi:hypothetical protein